MKRTRTNPRIDDRIFSETARSVKSINVPVKNFRGGIRL